MDELQIRLGIYTALFSEKKVVPTTAATAAVVEKATSGAVSKVSKSEEEDTPEMIEKFNLVRSIGEECIDEKDLKALLRAKPSGFRLYDGFEPSGRMHIAQGVFKALNVNKATKAGGTFVFWVADWFALMNDKMGGDLEKIKTVGKYLVHVWRGVGMDMTHVEFKWASDEIVGNADKYWRRVLDIARRFSVTRVSKCCQIMGRKEGSLTAAQLLYAIMQCADIFHLDANICQLGVDQRKVNMLAREYCDFAGIKFKPIILSHHMLFGLIQGQEKMSKSNPDSAIFMEDTPEDVRRKIFLAYCPRIAEAVSQEQSEDSLQLNPEDNLKNPCLDYLRHIVMNVSSTITIAGNEYSSYDDIKQRFLSGEISEVDLKETLVLSINKLLDPVRAHFINNEEAREVLELVKSYKRGGEELTKKALPSGDVKRLKLSIIKPNTGIVFAPLPTSTSWSLSEVLTVLKQVNQDGVSALVIPDLGAFAMSCLIDQSDKKFDPKVPNQVIQAAYISLIESLEALEPMLFKSSVRIIWQSQAILENASDYWISVINVGRCFSSGRVKETALDEVLKDRVGHILMALMHVGMILACSPSKIISDRFYTPLNNLALEYYASSGITALPVFEIVDPGFVDASIADKTQTGNDVEFRIFDAPAQDTKKKVKQAFCEPGNVDYNPVIVLANEIAFRFDGMLNIQRPEEYGGNVTYKDLSLLSADFKSGALHPGDLKKAIGEVMDKVMKKLELRFKENPSAKNAKAVLTSKKKN